MVGGGGVYVCVGGGGGAGWTAKGEYLYVYTMNTI